MYPCQQSYSINFFIVWIRCDYCDWTNQERCVWYLSMGFGCWIVQVHYQLLMREIPINSQRQGPVVRVSGLGLTSKMLEYYSTKTKYYSKELRNTWNSSRCRQIHNILTYQKFSLGKCSYRVDEIITCFTLLSASENIYLFINVDDIDQQFVSFLWWYSLASLLKLIFRGAF